MTLTRKLQYFFVAVLGFALLVTLPNYRIGTLRFSAQVFWRMIDNDSTYYMDRAWAVLKAGKPLYPTLFFEQHLKFIYPASSLLTYVLAEHLHISGRRLIDAMVYLSLAGTLVIAGEVFLIALPQEVGAIVEVRDRRLCRLMVAGIGMIFFPLLLGVCTGQIQTVMTFLFTLAVYFWLRGDKAWAGICLALICAFKPTLLVFLVWALLRREWRFFLSFAAACVAVQSAAIAAFGWHNEVDYVAVLNFISHRGEALSANQTFNGLLQRMTHNGSPMWSRTSYPPYNWIVYGGTVVSSAALLGSGLLFPLGQRWKGQTRDFIVFGLLATMASPIAWEHHYGYFYVASVFFLAVTLGSVDLKRLPSGYTKGSRRAQAYPPPSTKDDKGGDRYMNKESALVPFRFGMISGRLYIFLGSFVVLANSWEFLTSKMNNSGGLLLSYDLLAGLAMVLLLALPGLGVDSSFERGRT